MIELIGTIAIWVGLCVVLALLWKWTGELAWEARWKWGNVHQSMRYVRRGWNTGEPPEGRPILVANNIKDQRSPLDGHCWAVMVRRGDRVQTLSGGMSMPVKNVTAWLEVFDDIDVLASYHGLRKLMRTLGDLYWKDGDETVAVELPAQDLEDAVEAWDAARSLLNHLYPETRAEILDHYKAD